MKNSKSILTIFLLIFMALGTAVTLNSCKDDDPCDGVECLNGGVCNDGNCNCATGFEGTNCGTAMADKFVGTWKYNETCGGFTIVDFTVTISKNGANKIQMSGFGGYECNGSNILVNATVSGREITIDPNQSFCSGTLTINSGTGSINESLNAINVTYTSTIPGSPSITCSGIYTK